MITPTNPGGDLDINDMEMAGKLLAWLALEGIVGTENLCYGFKLQRCFGFKPLAYEDPNMVTKCRGSKHNYT